MSCSGFVIKATGDTVPEKEMNKGKIYRLSARRVLIYEDLLNYNADPHILNSAIDLIHDSIMDIGHFDSGLLRHELGEEVLSGLMQRCLLSCEICGNTDFMSRMQIFCAGISFI